MTSQTPSFAGCTTYPGGTPILNGGQTSSTGIELISRDGVPHSPFEILDNNVVLSKPNSQFNASGAFVEQFQGLALGGHHYQLRANASSLPTSEWRLTVSQQALGENFETVPQQVIVQPGQIIDCPTMTISFTGPGAVAIGTYNYPMPPISGHFVFISPNNQSTERTQFRLKSTYSRVSFWYTSTLRPATAYSYDGNGNLLETRPMQLLNIPATAQMLFTVPGIRTVEIAGTLRDNLIVDNFEFVV